VRTLEQQLFAYGEYQKDLHRPIDLDRLAVPAVFEPERDAKRTSRAWVAFATAVVLAILVGALPLVARFGGTGPSSDSNPATTAVTPATVQPGSRLAFVPVDLPAGEPHFWNSAWYRGVLYAAADNGAVYSTEDGFTWQVETQFDRFRPTDPSAGTFRFNDVVTDGERLVVVGETDHLEKNGERCSLSDHLLRVIVVNPDGSSTSSDVPIPPPLLDDDCVSNNLAVTASRLGVVVSGSIATHPPAHTERAVGLFSADGLNWTDLGRVPPFHSAQVEQIVVTPGRFLAIPTGPGGDGPVYGSEDGLTWEVADEIDVDEVRSIGLWAGKTVMRGPTGIVALDRPGDVLVDVDDLPKFSRLFFGQMGIIGAGTGGYGNDVPTDSPFSFSVDGTTWEHWTPAEFEGLDTMLGLIGMGDDFIVFFDWEGQRLWIGRPTGGAAK
jgi:hypothetical protein